MSSRVLIALAFAALSSVGLGEPGAARKPWRGGWAGLRKPDALIASAKATGFNALMVHAPIPRMKSFTALAKKNGIETYFWFSPTVSRRNKEMAPFAQKMRPEDDKRLAEINADKDPARHGYQSGGEPIPGRHETLRTRLLCFHRPETVAYGKAKIKEMLDACPAMTGVALDYFGYQNYRCCVCPHSMKQFDAYLKSHPGPRAKALDDFSRTTLVNVINEMSDFVRKVRPGAKVAIHIYPTFLPEPLYGNRLDLDYCCQTVAWFFKPYWSREKIERYTRIVVTEQNKYYRRQRGIPFVGVYVGRPYADKSPQRLAEELRIVHKTAGNADLSVCSFNEFVKHPETRHVVKKALSEVRAGGKR